MNGPDDETRAALLEAARGLLERDGPNALTVRRIAAEAGMSTMNVYSRFGGKDGVVDELYCEGFHRLRSYVAKHGVSDDPLENFRAPGIAYRDFALENRTFYTVMFFRPIPGYTPSPSARQIAREGFDELVARMRELMESGDIAAGDPHKVAACHWATCHGHVGLEISKVGPAEIDWETTLLSSLDALHSSMS
ncbi:MAG: TetR/AcrR family transcriptional regulator [Ilumatobacteraceae bacterium]